MSKYLFKVTWFGPNGKRYRKARHKDDFREIPDHFVDQLPSSAKPYEPGGVEQPVTSVNELHANDALRAASEADPYKSADEREFAESMAQRAARQARTARTPLTPKQRRLEAARAER